MNRREFIGSLAALAVVPSLPRIDIAPPATPPTTAISDLVAYSQAHAANLYNEIYNDPTYQFRLDAGRRALNNR